MRIDQATRIIHSCPSAIYQALTDPDALVAWLPPQGMTGSIDVFDLREGGTYRMTLTYDDPHLAGKTTAHSDTVNGRFLRLITNERVEQLVSFVSDDPAFAGEMKTSWLLRRVPGGTEVAVRCDNVPPGIRPEDHEAGLASSLENLARFTERREASS